MNQLLNQLNRSTRPDIIKFNDMSNSDTNTPTSALHNDFFQTIPLIPDHYSDHLLILSYTFLVDCCPGKSKKILHIYLYNMDIPQACMNQIQKNHRDKIHPAVSIKSYINHKESIHNHRIPRKFTHIQEAIDFWRNAARDSNNFFLNGYHQEKNSHVDTISWHESTLSLSPKQYHPLLTFLTYLANTEDYQNMDTRGALAKEVTYLFFALHEAKQATRDMMIYLMKEYTHPIHTSKILPARGIIKDLLNIASYHKDKEEKQTWISKYVLKLFENRQ